MKLATVAVALTLVAPGFPRCGDLAGRHTLTPITGESGEEER